MNEICKLLENPLRWVIKEDSVRFFHTNAYDENVCWLRINDFPDEPLWTLYYDGETISFDDQPKSWTIIYEPEKL